MRNKSNSYDAVAFAQEATGRSSIESRTTSVSLSERGAAALLAECHVARERVARLGETAIREVLA